MTILFFGIFEFLLNIPFGAWRSGTRKYSLLWFIAIHSPVPIIIIARLITGVHYEWRTLPFFLLCYATGQFMGGKIGIYYRDRKRITK